VYVIPLCIAADDNLCTFYVKLVKQAAIVIQDEEYIFHMLSVFDALLGLFHTGASTRGKSY